jgi:hypothetical protein
MPGEGNGGSLQYPLLADYRPALAKWQNEAVALADLSHLGRLGKLNTLEFG